MKQVTCIFFVISFVLLFIGCGKGPTIDPDQVAYNTSMGIKKASISFSGNEDNDVNVLHKKCKDLHELDSCYMAGLYYEKQSETNSSMQDKALYYYDLGCFHFYDNGFLKKNIQYKTDKYSCLGQARIFKNKKDIPNYWLPLPAVQFKKAAEYYYKEGDFEKALEYCLATITKGKFYDANIYYILSQMALKGEGQKIDYELSKKYYLQYILNSIELKNADFLKMLIHKRLHTDSVSMELKMTLNADGTVGDVNLTKPSDDDMVNQEFVKQIKERTYHPIPAEYGMKTIEIPIIY